MSTVVISGKWDCCVCVLFNFVLSAFQQLTCFNGFILANGRKKAGPKRTRFFFFFCFLVSFDL